MLIQLFKYLLNFENEICPIFKKVSFLNHHHRIENKNHIRIEENIFTLVLFRVTTGKKRKCQSIGKCLKNLLNMLIVVVWCACLCTSLLPSLSLSIICIAEDTILECLIPYHSHLLASGEMLPLWALTEATEKLRIVSPRLCCRQRFG